MISYRDMTFCPFNKDCADAKTCPRAYTDEVKRKAAEWWGGADAPVSLFVEKPSCHRKVDNDTPGD